MAEAKRQTLGRRRIECKIIENKAAREVTFSKRHRGMFWKASELAILCGAEVAIIAYSPRGNPFIFGHPSVDAVINRYVSGGVGAQANEAVDNALYCAVDEHKKQYQNAVFDLEKAKRIKIKFKKRRVARNFYGQMWWDEEVEDGVGVEELKHYVASLENLINKVADRVGIETCV